MGTRYLFTCQCGYGAKVAGDFDICDAGATTTIACRTCKRLYDVKLPATYPEPPDSAINLKPDGCPRARITSGECGRILARAAMWRHDEAREMLALWTDRRIFART